MKFFGASPKSLLRKNESRTLIIYSSNELIEDTLQYVLLSGFRVVKAPPLPLKPTEITEHPEFTPDKEYLATILEQEIKELGCIESEIASAAIQEILCRLSESLKNCTSYQSTIDEYIKRIELDVGGPIVFLANSMTSPQELLLRDSLRNKRIPIIVVEHGVAPGLSTLHQSQLAFETPDDYDGMAFWTPIQQREVQKALQTLSEQTAVVGSPRRMKHIGLESFQRFIVRQSLGITRKDRLITWCTGLFPNNMQYLPHYWRDGAYHHVRRQILFEILAEVNYELLLKLYPTYRFNDPDPFSKIEHLPKNTRVAQFEDFRCLRAATDAIIVDGPGSVLGWAWGCNKPLVYIETGMYTLRDEIAKKFKDAIFYVDIREDGWKEKLKSILERPYRDLAAEYAAKAKRRREIGIDCVYGGAGNPAIRLMDFIDSYSRKIPSDVLH
jgi:hypothetical protein